MQEIRCAQCHADLTRPDNDLAFRLYLVEQSKYNNPNAALSALQYHNHHYHFCDYECLRGWVVDREM